MSTIYELRKKIIGNYRKELYDAVNEIATRIIAAANCIPEEDLREFVEYNPKSNEKLLWIISKSDAKIFFEGYMPIHQWASKIGNGYQFDSNCVECCNQLLVKRDYDFEISPHGFFNIVDNTIGLRLKVRADLKKEVVLTQRFIRDLEETFPECRIENELLWKDGTVNREDGGITLVIK